MGHVKEPIRGRLNLDNEMRLSECSENIYYVKKIKNKNNCVLDCYDYDMTRTSEQ